LRKEFRELPLHRKLSTLAELEAVTMFQSLGALIEVPFTIGEKLMGVVAGWGRSLNERDRRAHRPPEHQRNEAEQTSTEDQKV